MNRSEQFYEEEREHEILRPTLQWFAEWMEKVLKANDHKGGWLDMEFSDLIKRLREETRELDYTTHSHHVPWIGNGDTGDRAPYTRIEPIDWHTVVLEATDVANFAMMIADIANRRALGQVRERGW